MIKIQIVDQMYYDYKHYGNEAHYSDFASFVEASFQDPQLIPDLTGEWDREELTDEEQAQLANIVKSYN